MKYKRPQTYSKNLPKIIVKFCDASRYESPVLWNVKMQGRVEFEQVWQRMCKEHFINEAEALTIIGSKQAVEEAWDDDTTRQTHWEWSLESMQASLTDDDTYKCCRPKVYARWGLDPNTDKLWDVTYQFVGRSGGYLMMTEFEGYKLTDRDVWEMEDGVRATEAGIPGEVAQKLCAMIEEISLCVPHRHDELIYQMAWNMYHHMPEVISCDD